MAGFLQQTETGGLGNFLGDEGEGKSVGGSGEKAGHSMVSSPELRPRIGHKGEFP